MTVSDARQQQRERRLWLALGASAVLQICTLALIAALIARGPAQPLAAIDAGAEAAGRTGRQLLAAVSAWLAAAGGAVLYVIICS